MIIKWTNIHSQEQGYVKRVVTKDKCFENTFNPAEAKDYKTMKGAENIVKMLTEFGEAENNKFEIV